MQILQELESLIPPLSNEEFKQLERNILEEGIREPLITWNGILIDGHNRYRIAQEHDMNYETLEKEFEDLNAVKIWMVNNQLGRRNLQDFVRGELYSVIEEIIREKAKESKSEKVSYYRQKGEVLSIIDNTSSNTQKIIADKLGWSTGKKAMFDIVKTKAPEEVKEKLRTGEVSINQAYKEIKKEEKIIERKQDIKKQLQDIESGKLPELWGKYEVVAIDPPWAYEEKGGLSSNDFNPQTTRGTTTYPTMKVNQIKEIDLPLTDNSVVFLWTTHAFLKDAFDILEHWNLKYKATLVWDKEKMGMGRTIRLQCEFCLIAFKGNPIFNGSSERDIIRESRREHSRKPEAFYQYVERSTIGRKLEYFSREKRTNWEIYGNEVNKF
jgi:N6-adenosine-specific RNA methylase IME4/ParB-like chromosome segregation protein Spo0J